MEKENKEELFICHTGNTDNFKLYVAKMKLLKKKINFFS